MKTCFKYLVVAGVFSGLLIPLSSLAITGDEILTKVDETFSAPRDQEMTMVMTLVDKRGNKKVRKMKVWQKTIPGKDDWRLIKFISPPDVRGVGFLVLADDRMYLYMPAFKKVRRIASHTKNESFMGSDLSYDDMSTSHYEKHYTAEIVKEDENFYYLKAERKKGSDKPYPTMDLKIDKRSWFPVEIKKYDEGGNLWKVFRAKHRKIGKYWAMVEMEVEDVKKEHRTLLKMENIEFDTGLPDKLFTQRNLKRRVR